MFKIFAPEKYMTTGLFVTSLTIRWLEALMPVLANSKTELYHDE
jgi:hypothetical protein